MFIYSFDKSDISLNFFKKLFLYCTAFPFFSLKMKITGIYLFRFFRIMVIHFSCIFDWKMRKLENQNKLKFINGRKFNLILFLFFSVFLFEKSCFTDQTVQLSLTKTMAFYRLTLHFYLGKDQKFLLCSIIKYFASTVNVIWDMFEDTHCLSSLLSRYIVSQLLSKSYLASIVTVIHELALFKITLWVTSLIQFRPNCICWHFYL